MNRLDDVLRYRIDPTFSGPGNAPSGSSAPASAIARNAAIARCPAIAAAGPARVKLAGHLELRAVSFGYSRLDPPLIEGLSLVVETRLPGRPGRRLGQRQVHPLPAGHRPLRALEWRDPVRRPEPVRAAAAVSSPSRSSSVDQNVFLFEGTVRDNLTLWDSTIPLPEVVAAAKDACIHEEIAARAGGYDSLIEEGGANWSGGQRQRLEIARALVQPAHGPGARRGHERSRPHHREPDRPGPAAAGLHLPHRGAPAEHHPGRRRDHRAGERQGRPAGDPRRAQEPGRPLRPSHQRRVSHERDSPPRRQCPAPSRLRPGRLADRGGDGRGLRRAVRWLGPPDPSLDGGRRPDALRSRKIRRGAGRTRSGAPCRGAPGHPAAAVRRSRDPGPDP